MQQQVQHRIFSKSEASNTQEENHSGIASRVSLNEKEATSGAQSPKVNTEQAKQEKGKKQTRLSNWLQNNSEEKAIDVNLQTQVQNPEKMKETESLALNRKMRERW